MSVAEAAAGLLLDRAPRLGAVRLGGVDGPSGSGKSTFAAAWAAELRAARSTVAVFSSDLLATWDDPFGWWPRFDAGVLQPLARGLPGRIRLTDWSAGEPQPGDWLDLKPVDVLILEGVSCGRAAVRDRASVLVWVEVRDWRERLERAVRRDGESSRGRLAAWQDAEDGFFRSDRTADRADLLERVPEVLPDGGMLATVTVGEDGAADAVGGGATSGGTSGGPTSDDAHRYRWRDQIRDTVRALGPEDTQPMPRIAREPPPIPPDLVELLRALGVALLNSADSSATTTEMLEEVAAAYDVDVQAMVMPTGILFRIGTDEVDLVSVPNRSLRLDQIAQVNDLIEVLRRGTISPSLALRRLHQILTSPPRFGPWLAVLGQVILSVGFGLLLNPDLLALPFYAALGAFVALLRMVADKWVTLSVALPVIASFLVTVLAVKVVAPFVHDDPIRLVAPALITFLPGATLTIATIELASDQIVSGASRLVWGVSQLLLLAFGVFVGLSLVGTVDASGARQVGAWAPWVGVALVGIGYLLFTSAPPGSLLFLWIALFASYAAQTVGAALLDPALSGFVGGLLIVPLTHALARFRRSPPAAVMLLPAFWLLLPGALGFRGVSSLATGIAGGATDLVVTGISIFAVALGVLVGTSVTRDARAVHRSWRIRFRRAGGS